MKKREVYKILLEYCISRGDGISFDAAYDTYSDFMEFLEFYNVKESAARRAIYFLKKHRFVKCQLMAWDDGEKSSESRFLIEPITLAV